MSRSISREKRNLVLCFRHCLHGLVSAERKILLGNPEEVPCMVYLHRGIYSQEKK